MGEPARKGSENPAETGHRYIPGQSGNPGGRPKGLAAEVRRIYPADQLVDVMVKIAQGESVAGLKPRLSDVQRANEWLADRGWGKAVDHVPVEGGDPLERGPLADRISEVLDELAAKRTAESARKGS